MKGKCVFIDNMWVNCWGKWRYIVGMENLLTTLGEEVGNMLISCPDISHIFSVQHKESSTVI